MRMVIKNGDQLLKSSGLTGQASASFTGQPIRQRIWVGVSTFQVKFLYCRGQSIGARVQEFNPGIG